MTEISAQRPWKVQNDEKKSQSFSEVPGTGRAAGPWPHRSCEGLSESVRGERGMDCGGAWGGVARGLLTLLLLPLLSSYLVSI